MYFFLASIVFGIYVPSGNFIPALTIGASMGRLIGELAIMAQGGSIRTDMEAGLFALVGAAAGLGGVTRMTIAIAVILVEVTDDAKAILPMIFVLTIAKMTGDLFTPSFDDAMIHLNKLPFLEEEPPHEYELLTARDVMARSVVVLRERERVSDLLAVLERTEHNGFPIIDPGCHNEGTFFAGIILRRQLLPLFQDRIWELQDRGAPLSETNVHHFVDSAFGSRKKALSTRLSAQDTQATLDLRSFMDPSPYVVNELMPLRRVYRLFNEIGVRHLPVVDCREQVVGIITRKDLLPENIEKSVLAPENIASIRQAIASLTARKSSKPAGSNHTKEGTTIQRSRR